jgi:hypothetical protein
MLFISSWFGRNGNNILQLVRAIHYAKIHEHNIIYFPSHELLSTNSIKINKNIDSVNPEKISDSFFYKKTGLPPVKLREYSREYIQPILIFNINRIITADLCIHIRGGDNFNNNPNPAYVQPPLKYYIDIINQYKDKNILIVYEDKNNPCINELLKFENLNFQSSSLIEDIRTLINCENVVIGFGTFGFMIYLLSNKLKNLYIPQYYLTELPLGEYGINLYTVNLRNYIKLGGWKNTKEQQEYMIKYTG